MFPVCVGKLALLASRYAAIFARPLMQIKHGGHVPKRADSSWPASKMGACSGVVMKLTACRMLNPRADYPA